MSQTACKCLVWEYLGGGEHRCVVCGAEDDANGVPNGAVLIHDDCGICVQNAAAMSLADIDAHPTHSGLLHRLRGLSETAP